MIVYSIILFGAAALFLAFGISIHKGNTKLIHDYHRANVSEARRPEYGRAFAKGLFVLGAALLVSGSIALLGNSRSAVIASVIVLAAGILISVVIFMRVQRKYNKGVF